MSEHTLLHLVDEAPDPRSPNRRTLSVGKRVEVTFYFLKDTCSLNTTVNSFGIVA